MTAKEITEDIMSEIDTQMKPPEDVSMIFETFRDDIRAYAREKCKEQRALCADNVFWENGKETDPQYMKESIEDAPKPKFN